MYSHKMQLGHIVKYMKLKYIINARAAFNEDIRKWHVRHVYLCFSLMMVHVGPKHVGTYNYIYIYIYIIYNDTGKQDSLCSCNVISRRVHTTIFAEENKKSITYYERVFVAVGIQHVKRVRLMAICGVSGSTIFCLHYLINGMIFEKSY